MDTCPASVWANLNPEALKAKYDVLLALKNGPRGFTMDTMKIPTGPVVNFDGVNARWMGTASLPVDFKAGLEAYKPLQSDRKSKLTFEKETPVFVLDDAGTAWVM